MMHVPGFNVWMNCQIAIENYYMLYVNEWRELYSIAEVVVLHSCDDLCCTYVAVDI